MSDTNMSTVTCNVKMIKNGEVIDFTVLDSYSFRNATEYIAVLADEDSIIKVAKQSMFNFPTDGGFIHNSPDSFTKILDDPEYIDKEMHAGRGVDRDRGRYSLDITINYDIQKVILDDIKTTFTEKEN